MALPRLSTSIGRFNSERFPAVVPFPSFPHTHKTFHNHKEKIVMSIFQKIVAGLDWVGKEIGKGLAGLPKVIKLTEDAEDAATTALPETIAVIQDAGALVAASAKDSGKFLVSLATLTAAVTVAVGSKALSISADTAVVAAFESFCADFNAANVQDVLTAWDKLATDAKKLDTTVLNVLEKMKADA
jgi:hypothetical protein